MHIILVNSKLLACVAFNPQIENLNPIFMSLMKLLYAARSGRLSFMIVSIIACDEGTIRIKPTEGCWPIGETHSLISCSLKIFDHRCKYFCKLMS